MLDKFSSFFKVKKTSLTKDTTGKPTDKDIQIATAVLLLELAGADSDYAPEETQTMFNVLGRQFGLTEDQCLEILEAADALRRSETEIADFVSIINNSFEPAQRERILAMAWRIILADGHVDKFERRLAEQFRNRLQLNEEQAERARVSAERGKV